MQINDKDAGAYLKVVSCNASEGLAGGTGDNTAINGAIVDQQAHEDLRSGIIVVTGTATLADTESISLNAVKIEHGDQSNLSDAADYTYATFTEVVNNADYITSDGGTTEEVSYKQRINLQGVKRYWRVTVTPDLSATGTDTFYLGICAVLIGSEAPLS